MEPTIKELLIMAACDADYNAKLRRTRRPAGIARATGQVSKDGTRISFPVNPKDAR